MEPVEEGEQLFIFVIDESYDGEEDTYPEDSHRYRQGLESEFGTATQYVNIGPGADLPAFLIELATKQIPLWSVIGGAFFLGKAINENLDAWRDIARKVRSFFGRPVILARHGASVLAVEAVFDELGGMPKTVRLLAYMPGHYGRAIAESW